MSEEEKNTSEAEETPPQGGAEGASGSETPPEGEAEAAEGAKTPPLPDPDLVSLAQMFFVPAMMSTGKVPSPATGKQEVDLNMAKYQIQLLELLKEKTEGNRSDEENGTIDNMLDMVRMAFVEVSQHPQEPES